MKLSVISDLKPLSIASSFSFVHSSAQYDRYLSTASARSPLTFSIEVFKFSEYSDSSCSLISETFEDTAALKIVLAFSEFSSESSRASEIFSRSSSISISTSSDSTLLDSLTSFSSSSSSSSSSSLSSSSATSSSSSSSSFFFLGISSS